MHRTAGAPASGKIKNKINETSRRAYVRRHWFADNEVDVSRDRVS